MGIMMSCATLSRRVIECIHLRTPAGVLSATFLASLARIAAPASTLQKATARKTLTTRPSALLRHGSGGPLNAARLRWGAFTNERIYFYSFYLLLLL